MIALQITEIKPFMNQLFLENAFDAFLLSEATFVTFGTFHIDGSFKKEYYSAEELETQQMTGQTYAQWRQVRPFGLELIKGKHTPLEFRIIFRLSPANVEKLLLQAQISISPSDVDGLFLNLHYRTGTLSCTTGTSLCFFTLDKTLDHTWDAMVKKFFEKQHISYEEV